MAMQPFITDGGRLNIGAVLEQSTLLASIYWNDQANAQAALDSVGGADILNFQYDRDSFPPSWMIVRQGSNLYVIVAGTTNPQQWVGNVIGAYAAPYDPYPCRIHSFFNTEKTAVKNQFTPFLPADWRQCQLHFVGHSLGAAIAFLLSLDYVQDNPGMTIRALLFAPPKSLTVGYNGPLPQSLDIVINTGDGVPYLPPNQIVSTARVALGPIVWAIPIPWTHYGRITEINSGGTIVSRTTESIDGSWDLRLVGSTYANHYMGAYASASNAVWQRLIDAGPDGNVLQIAARIISAVLTQTMTNRVDSLASVNTQVQNAVTWLRPVDGPLSQENLPLVNSVFGGVTGFTAGNPIFTAITGDANVAAIKIQFFYHVNKAGFSESWYVDNQTPQGYDTSRLVQYLRQRMAISGPQTTWDYIRISAVGTRNAVAIFAPGDLVGAPNSGTYAPGHSTQVSDFGGTSLVVRKVAATRFSRFFLRGIPDEIVSGGGLYTPTADFSTGLDNFATFLRNNSYAWKGTAGPSAGSPAPITAAAANPDGTILFTLANTLFAGMTPIVTRRAVRISGQVAPAYLNGNLTVTVLSPTTCSSLRVQPLVGFQAGSGKMFLNNVSAYIVPQSLVVERVRQKAPGNVYGGYRGRPQKRVRS